MVLITIGLGVYGGGSLHAQSTPAQSTPAQSTPAQSTPVQNTPAQTAGCFRTAAEAAAGQGARAEVGGFRLQAVIDDVLGSGRWAAVAHCGHPEWPAVMLRGARAPRASAIQAAPPSAPSAAPPAASRTGTKSAVAAGEAVRLIRTEENVRLEVGAVAEASGALGDRIRVRLERGAESAEERFCFAVVRGPGVVEMER